VSRENAAAKGKRYVSEGRLVVRQLDEHTGTVQADCRGNGSIYSCGRDDRGWFCDCAARTTACAHLEALRLVVAVTPRDAQP
jgi:hypothetical protein